MRRNGLPIVEVVDVLNGELMIRHDALSGLERFYLWPLLGALIGWSASVHAEKEWPRCRVPMKATMMARKPPPPRPITTIAKMRPSKPHPFSRMVDRELTVMAAHPMLYSLEWVSVSLVARACFPNGNKD